MFGTIGHARIKTGSMPAFDALMDDWAKTIRPGIPGKILNLKGHRSDDEDTVVFMALVENETAYRDLAANPAQDVWFRKLSALIDGEVTWEDVSMEILIDG